MNLVERCRSIRLILTDVDGVLTDGKIALNNDGIESKQFHIRDGLGVRLWQRSGGTLGIVTGRSSRVVQLRASELDIEPVAQGVSDKLAKVREICGDMGVQQCELAYIGDDLPDLPAIRWAGLGVSVADAAEEVRQASDYMTSVQGGGGALRELVEVVLKNNGQWNAVIDDYTD